VRRLGRGLQGPWPSLRPGSFGALHRHLMWTGSKVAGMPEVGPLGIDVGRHGPLAHAQTSVSVGTEIAPELEAVVAGQRLEPECSLTGHVT
jgi:hypothetical protein